MGQVDRRVLGVFALVLPLFLGLSTGAAQAAPTLTVVNPTNLELASGGYVTVSIRWSGVTPGPDVFLTMCREDGTSDPSFSVAADCEPMSFDQEENARGSGSTDLDTAVEKPPATAGFLCGAPGETVPPGVTLVTTCYVRLTVGSPDDNADQVFAAATFYANQDVNTPEIGYPVLLPLSGIAGVVGALAIRRRRRARVTT